MYTRAIVRTPGKSFGQGLTTAGLGPPDYQKALQQHTEYIHALQFCGLEVLVMEPDERFPDSTFVEDTALITPHCAIITNLGAPSRKGEIANIREILIDYYEELEEIHEPGTVEGGDILQINSHYYIGLSERTNPEGAHQMIQILMKYGLSGSTVSLEHVLHLKTGISYLGENTILAAGEFLSKTEFKSFQTLRVPHSESYAANSIRINDYVLVPAGFPQTKALIESAGYQIRTVNVSEFQKMDGGLSCLSVRL